MKKVVRKRKRKQSYVTKVETISTTIVRRFERREETIIQKGRIKCKFCKKQLLIKKTTELIYTKSDELKWKRSVRGKWQFPYESQKHEHDCEIAKFKKDKNFRLVDSCLNCTKGDVCIDRYENDESRIDCSGMKENHWEEMPLDSYVCDDHNKETND